MNIKEYISSGKMESYVLGLASEGESSEFEQLCLQYPELASARNEFEEALERMAFREAIAPPRDVKEIILNKIHTQETNEDKEVKVISIEQKPRIAWLRYAAAASVILLVISAYFVYDLYSKNEKLKNSFSRIQSQLDSLSDQMAFEHRIVTDPNVAVVSLVGTQQSNHSSASIYWDTASANVYMLVKNIPKLPSDKQYQLWAFIEGKPVDLGLFDADKPRLFLKMKNTQKAEAFAITIEKRGNGPVPHGTVETIGKTKL